MYRKSTKKVQECNWKVLGPYWKSTGKVKGKYSKGCSKEPEFICKASRKYLEGYGNVPVKNKETIIKCIGRVPEKY